MSFESGEKVFAKLRKLPPWPGQIWECREKKYVIRFYPDGDKKLVKGKYIFPFLKFFPSLKNPPISDKFHNGVQELLRDMTATELIALMKRDKGNMFQKFYDRLYFKTDDIDEFNFMNSLRRLETFNFVLSSTQEEKKPSLIGMCVRALEDLKRMDISSDILLGYTKIVLTVLRLRNFTAIIDESMSKEEVSEINRRSEIVRIKATEVYDYFEKICPFWHEGFTKEHLLKYVKNS